MKYISLLLSILVMTLSTVPCCATEIETAQFSNIKTGTSDHTPKEKDHECCEHCSPFFTCGSCTGFILAQSFSYEIRISFHTSKAYSLTFLVVYYLNVSSAIWQPPKLS